MRILVDAQLPLRLAHLLASVGHDVVHSSELADGNRTTDQVLTALADREDRVVVSKDRDFEISHLLRRRPRRLLLVTTGNISNSELLGLFAQNLASLNQAFDQGCYVELSARAITIHGDLPD